MNVIIYKLFPRCRKVFPVFFNNMKWSTVSQTLLWSSKTRMQIILLSRSALRFSITSVNSVIQLLPLINPYCIAHKILWLLTYSLIGSLIIFSITLNKRGKVNSLFCLGIGVIFDFFHSSGNVDLVSIVLNTWVT